MKFQFLIYCYFFLFLTCPNSVAQVKNSNKDSVKVYTDIEKYSRKSKFNKFVSGILFKPRQSPKTLKRNAHKRYIVKKQFDKYQGKIIRNINIETLDPFGYAVDDDKKAPQTGFENFGDRLHIKTRIWTIQNLLLFKKNQPLDSIPAKETERLIRRQRSVRSVIIKPVEIPNSKDSVDISVRVLDSWSIIPTGSFSSSHTTINIAERNFLGLGHEFENNFSRYFDTNQSAYRSKYTINSIKNTYIGTQLLYEKTRTDDMTKSARIERTFFSPITTLAGGVFFENRRYTDSLPNNNGIFENQVFKLETQEYWLGHSFKIFKGASEDFRTTNLVTSIGYKHDTFPDKPPSVYDPSNFLSSQNLYLASIGINTRKYAEEKYLFRYGIIEDVPFGQLYQFTAGYQYKNNIKRNYYSGRIAYGDYYNIGYLSLNFEWGSFFNNGSTEETTFRFEANYFTKLLSMGNWKIRQFIKPTLIIGNNRAPILKDRVSFSEENGITGFGNRLINGSKKFLMAFQTQSYVPGNWKGFHFSPFVNITLGLLGNETDKFFDDKLYSKIGIGILINNEYIVFDNFQISFSFYPSIPYEGTNVFKVNTFKNNDISLPDFQIGQPKIVLYK